MFFPFIKLPGKSAEDTAQLNELFVSYETTGTQAWGKPFCTDPDEDPTVVWQLPNHTATEVVGGPDMILSTLFTPQGSFIYG